MLRNVHVRDRLAAVQCVKKVTWGPKIGLFLDRESNTAGYGGEV